MCFFCSAPPSMESFYHIAKRMTWASEQQQLQATLQAFFSLSHTHTHTCLSAGVNVCYAGWSSVEVIRLSVCLQPALSLYLSLSLSLSHPKLHTLQIFNSFIDVFFTVDPLSPSIYVSPSTVKTHSPSQAYTHQVSLNEFFINWSHFLSFSPMLKVFSSPSGRQINVLLSGFDSHEVSECLRN